MTTLQSAVRLGKARSKKRGFTLIEILVVIVIIAVLASTVGPAILKHVGEAKTQTARDQIAALSNALDSYLLDTGHYPTTQQGLAALNEMPTIDPPNNWRGPYMQKAIPLDPWQVAYIYECPGTVNPSRFDLYTFGKDGQAGGEDIDPDNLDVTSWN